MASPTRKYHGTGRDGRRAPPGSGCWARALLPVPVGWLLHVGHVQAQHRVAEARSRRLCDRTDAATPVAAERPHGPDHPPRRTSGADRSHQPRPMPSERLVRCARRKGGALRLLSWQWRKSKPPARAPPDHCKRFYEPQCGSNAPEADGTANCVGGYGGPERIMPFWPRIHVQLRHVHVPTQSWTYGDAHGGSTGELSDLLGPHGWAVRPAVGLQGPAQAVPLKGIDTQCLHSSRRAPRKSQCFHWRSASLYE